MLLGSKLGVAFMAILAFCSCAKSSRKSRQDAPPPVVFVDTLVLPAEDLAFATVHTYPVETLLYVPDVKESRVDKIYRLPPQEAGGQLRVHGVDVSYSCADDPGEAPAAHHAWTVNPATPEDAAFRPLDGAPLRFEKGAAHYVHVRLTRTAGCAALTLKFSARVTHDERREGGVTGDADPVGPLVAVPTPKLGKWRPVSREGALPGRSGHSAVWTGSHMLVFGGFAAWTEGGLQNTGAAYDPLTDTWRHFRRSGWQLSPRQGHAAAWTGSTMFVWGGHGEVDGRRTRLGDGALYDPATDTWMPLPSDGAPSPRSAARAIWTGDRIVVYGGICSDDGRGACPAAAYVPASGTWLSLETANEPLLSPQAAAVWTGTELLAWQSDNEAIGALFDPIHSRWRAMTLADAPLTTYASSDLQHHEPYTATLWDGRRLAVAGHETRGGPFGLQTFGEHVYHYDPQTDRWFRVEAQGQRPQAATGLIGFATESGVYLYSMDKPWAWGFTYSDRTWRPLADGAPQARFEGTYLWTGREFIVWGGRTYEPYAIIDDGAVFSVD